MKTKTAIAAAMVGALVLATRAVLLGADSTNSVAPPPAQSPPAVTGRPATSLASTNVLEFPTVSFTATEFLKRLEHTANQLGLSCVMKIVELERPVDSLTAVVVQTAFNRPTAKAMLELAMAMEKLGVVVAIPRMRVDPKGGTLTAEARFTFRSPAVGTPLAPLPAPPVAPSVVPVSTGDTSPVPPVPVISLANTNVLEFPADASVASDFLRLMDETAARLGICTMAKMIQREHQVDSFADIPIQYRIESATISDVSEFAKAMHRAGAATTVNSIANSASGTIRADLTFTFRYRRIGTPPPPTDTNTPKQ